MDFETMRDLGDETDRPVLTVRPYPCSPGAHALVTAGNTWLNEAVECVLRRAEARALRRVLEALSPSGDFRRWRAQADADGDDMAPVVG